MGWDREYGTEMGNGISPCFLASSRGGFGQAITKTLSIFRLNCYFLVIYISHSFRPAYGHLNELPGVLILVATATATKAVREDVIKKLEMQGCELVYTSPNRPNIYYAVQHRTDIETDFTSLVSDLQCNHNKAKGLVSVIQYVC